MEFSPRIFDTVMAISARLCCCPITRMEIKIRPRFITFRQLVSLVWRRAAFIFAILSHAWLRSVVSASLWAGRRADTGSPWPSSWPGRGPGRGPARGRGPDMGRGLSSYVRHNYWRQPLAAQLPAMSPGQLFVGDIGAVLRL